MRKSPATRSTSRCVRSPAVMPAVTTTMDMPVWNLESARMRRQARDQEA
jgi:hypothetical protein